MAREDLLSNSQRILVTEIRERIRTNGHAYIGDDNRFNPEQVRVLQSLDVVERRGDELLLVQDISPVMSAPRIEGFVSLRAIIDEFEHGPGGFPPALKCPEFCKPALPSDELEDGPSLEAA